MVNPDSYDRERQKEDRRREKLREKLEKKYRSGRIDQATYIAELHNIGYVTQKELVDDFRKMIQEEISYLESLEAKENETKDTKVKQTPRPPPPPPPPPKEYFGPEDLYRPTDDSIKTGKPADEDDRKQTDDNDEGPEEFSSDMADWEFEDMGNGIGLTNDNDNKDVRIKEAKTEVTENGEVIIRVDRNTGVLEYDDSKNMDFADAQIMDSFKSAEVVGSGGKKKKKRKRKSDKGGENGGDADIGPELSEAERLVIDTDLDEEEQLDLEEVLIPDIESTLKTNVVSSRKRSKPTILWEADREDRVWLEKRFNEEAVLLRERWNTWKTRKHALAAKGKVNSKKVKGAAMEDWELVKLVHETVLKRIKGKLKKVEKEKWKARLKKKKKVKKEKKANKQTQTENSNVKWD